MSGNSTAPETLPPVDPSPISDDEQAQSDDLRGFLVVVAILVAALGVAALAKTILIPISGAVLLSLSLSPLVRWLSRWRLPRGVVAVLVMVVIGAILSAGLLFVGMAFNDWINNAPQMVSTLERRLVTLQKPLGEIQQATENLEKMTESGDARFTPRVRVAPSNMLGVVLSESLNLVVSLMICMVLAMFLLATGEMFLVKFLSLFDRLGQKTEALRVVRECERDISRFLGVWTLVNICVGLVAWGAFALLGLPNAWLWGIAACLFNYVPYAGPFVNFFLVAVASLLAFDDLGRAVLPPLALAGINTVEGFFISPYVHSRRLQLNVVAVFLSVILGGWLWGVAGALMAVPMLAGFYVVCSHITLLQPVAMFLDDRMPSENGRDRGQAAELPKPSAEADEKQQAAPAPPRVVVTE
jgi:predicted PurR-regulated permease PerM